MLLEFVKTIDVVLDYCCIQCDVLRLLARPTIC